jgi:hypothetical protein
MKPSLATNKAKMLSAEVLGSQWLADGNEASERGDKERAEFCYTKAQFWLDRYNSLKDKSYSLTGEPK